MPYASWGKYEWMPTFGTFKLLPMRHRGESVLLSVYAVGPQISCCIRESKIKCIGGDNRGMRAHFGDSGHHGHSSPVAWKLVCSLWFSLVMHQLAMPQFLAPSFWLSFAKLSWCSTSGSTRASFALPCAVLCRKENDFISESQLSQLKRGPGPYSLRLPRAFTWRGFSKHWSLCTMNCC